MRIMRINFQKFINKRAIVDHGLPHFFGACLTALPPQRERASNAVVLDHDRMVHGQVGGAALEVLEWIAARRHHLRDELIGVPDRALRIVDKSRLDATPFTGERGHLFLSELVQVEAADALGALAQNRIGTRWTDSLDGPFVFGSKTFSQVDTLPAACVRPGCQRKQQDNNTNPDHHEGLRIHS
jgi:hypothetical protein